jgi:hypothetical protein
MRKLILTTMAMLVSIPLLAQDDDLYYTPKKDSAVKAAKETYYSGSDRDVDEYNRSGKYRNHSTTVDDSDIVFLDGEQGVYPDSLDSAMSVIPDSESYDDTDCDDYKYSRELNRWYGCYDPWLYGRAYFSPWYYRYGWHDPFYSSLYGWYDPWYYPYYSSWYGYYDPWYYGYYGGWYRPLHYGYFGPGGGGHHHDGLWAHGGLGAGYSNRGSVNTQSGTSGVQMGGGNRRTGGSNVYNDIAKRNQSSGRMVSSRRSVGSTQTYTDRSTTRTYTPTYRNSNAGSSSFSGGSRSGGGGFGGGSRGGGFSGGGGHGGRR